MKLITGKVVDGKIEVPPGELEDGALVAILATESDELVQLSAADEAELTRAMDAIARGEFVDGDELLERLRRRRQG